ncbi:MAG: CPBP family intramembrane metalloprotease domain-containing protein [Flavobacteriales bacterium]|nr:CPBP family intramembrane metalloprotease domain-containing protein [Flavobacteriales bacterium]
MIQLNGAFSKLLVLFGFCLLFGAIFSLAGLALIKPLFGLEFSDVAAVMSDLSSRNSIQVLKFLQLLNSIGLFLLPALLFSLLFIAQPKKELRLDQPISLWQIGFIFILYLSLIPLINLMVSINGELNLPESLEALEYWMRDAEDRAKALTEAFLQMEGNGDLWVNVMLMGLLPAVGEELIFRGIMQRTIQKSTRNHHIGIWVAAFFFSALHFQFYGFLPRMVLGAFFGYLLVWTNSLWAPILAHFINNTMALLIAYYYGSESLETEIDSLGSTTDTLWISGISLVVFSYFIYRFRQLSHKTGKVDMVRD